MKASINNLRMITEKELSKSEFRELYRKIEKKDISPTQRQRDFNGTYNVPRIRQGIYIELISEYLPDIKPLDLFPNQNATIVAD